MKHKNLFLLSITFLVMSSSILFNGCGQKSDLYNADLIISGGIVVTVNALDEIIENGMVVIKEDRIIAIGDSAELASQWCAPKHIDANGKLIMPGLINTHTHAPMTIFRGYADDKPLHEWLYDYIFPVESKFVNAHTVKAGTLLAMAEMIRSGTTTFNDMYYFVDEMAYMVEKSGLRAILTESVIDFPAPNSPTPEESMNTSRRLLEKWKGHPTVNIAISAHAPYSCSAELLQKSKALADEYGVIYNIHVAETHKEVDLLLKEKGMTPVKYLESLGVLGPNVVAAHCVHLSPEDIQIMAKHKVGVAHNPQCNMKLASGAAPIPQLIEAGVDVGIGTDGVASNNDLDMFDELNTAAILHKLTQNDPTVMDARAVIRAATINGAKVLGMDIETGSLEAGKKADLIMLDLQKPHAQPVYNIYSQIVYSLNGSDVEMMVVNGKILMQDYKLLTLNEKEIIKTVNEVAREIRNGLNERMEQKQ